MRPGPGVADFWLGRAGMTYCGLWCVNIERCIEIGASFSGNLLTQLGAQLRGFDFLHFTVIELAQLERPKRHADQPVDPEPERFENLAHLPVPALADGKGEPDTGALFPIKRRFDGPVVEPINGSARAQSFECVLADAAESTHAIAAEPSGRRQFQYTRKPAIVGEQQQTFGVDVESSDTDEPRQVLRQCAENSIASLRIGMACHKAARFVVEEKTCALARA